MKREIIDAIDESLRVKRGLKNLTEEISRVAHESITVLRVGGKIVLFGNGGSAADAQHIAGELLGKFMMTRDALPAIALTTNTSALTAIANDMSFDEVFSRQVEALVTDKDLVIGISTSGRSRDVLNGIKSSKMKGAKTVGLTGGDGGELAKIVDMRLIVPSYSTPRIQEVHILIGHILCELIEKELFGEGK